MTRFKGTPLFGKDSSTSHTSNVLSLIITFILWVIMGTGFVFVKPLSTKPEYKQVQIILPPLENNQTEKKDSENTVSSKVEEVVKKESVVKEQKIEKVVEQPKTQKNTETKKVVPQKKIEKSEKPVVQTKPKAVSEPVIYEDPMEAFNRQVSQKKKQDFDWSQFDDDSANVSVSKSAEQTYKVEQSSFSGSAGTTSDSSLNRQTSTNLNEDTKQQEVSSSTSNLLNQIASSEYSTNIGNGSVSKVSVKTVESTGNNLYIQMSDGKKRALLTPKSPVINLSDEAAKTIDGNRSVTIKFDVSKDGTVLYGSIEITPQALLSEVVKKEIREQISKWLFENTTYTSTASFEYKIIKK